jgi:hypothetical protein
MVLVPLDNQTPEDLDAEWYSREEAEQAKRLKVDNLLGDYYIDDIEDSSDEGVVRVGKSDDIGYILEKKLKTESELGYTVLADVLGVGPTTFYVRKDGDEIFLGEEFKRDFGMFEDQSYDGFADFSDYTHEVGKAAGRIWDANIMHDDLVRTEMNGKYSNTQYVANIMVSGPEDEASIIDMERARFEDWGPLRGIGTNMNQTVEDEKNAVKSAIMSEAIRSFDDMIERLYLDERSAADLFTLNDMGVKVVDEDALPPKLDEIITGNDTEPGVKNAFDRGVGDGRINQISAIQYVNNRKPFEMESNTPRESSEDLAEEVFHAADHWVAEQLEN